MPRCGGHAPPVRTQMTSLALLLIGTLTVTSYRSVPSQTDDSPFLTSTGEHVHNAGVAVSVDLLCPLSYGKTKKHSAARCQYKDTRLHYGDWVYVKQAGLKVVFDVMHPRHRRSIDVWVKTYQDEKTWGVRKLNVYQVETEIPSLVEQRRVGHH